ncbi:MAG: bifunctional D-glycero-beta-D-manno-heptose-7-phosphate kinase/D-glycero-beta-D-manno-heptose 1-phosphate adenylyltransferase HldE [Desulfobacterales bacterium]|nr:bifunctional D-glycero-beta-D-manno-heptose-7-phosphate kinase/D-glycero-beta-D-manno-heptose 1-phosphate adenylyltransferase HldE [Desulfobacterales bacterium]
MEFFPDFSNCTVTVIGDIMLDMYIWGEVERISPEAPVPVLKINERTFNLGGSGNVAANLAGLKCKTILIGTVGDDHFAELLKGLASKIGIDNSFVTNPFFPTTTKTRVIAQGQQLIRLDEEETKEFGDEISEKIIKQFEEVATQSNAVILSDYGKGVLKGKTASKIIEKCKLMKIPVFIDPKGKIWDKYKGATCITPNLSEFQAIAPLAKKDNLEIHAKRIIKNLGLEYLIVTKGKDGLSLFGKDFKTVHISAEAKEVFDVSGAGDTVISTLSACYGSGTSIENSAKIANAAAGIVVGKIGTQPIILSELKDNLMNKKITASNKSLTLDQAQEIISSWRNQGKRIVFTNGCFDILHVGHIKLLNSAAEEGDKLIIGLNSDSSIKRLKGSQRPIIPEEERAALLGSIRSVDLVIIFSEDTPLNLIEKIKPDVLVKGGDYTVETVVGHERVQDYGGKLILVPIVDGVSTTKVIESVKSRLK